MSKIILYPTNNNIAFVVPVSNSLMPVEEIARKDVPSGVPYKIFNTEDLPEDKTFMDAWETDFTNPDGYGIGHEAWFAEQENTQ